MTQSDRRSVPLTLTRRVFLGSMAAAGGVVLLGCTPGQSVAPIDGSQHHAHGDHPGGNILNFFTKAEADTVDAVIARLIPGDHSDPGAREAGVLYYIDGKLSTHETFAEPTYFQGPFARSPDDAAGGDGIPVDDDQLFRYGFQSDMLPRDLYREGLVGIDRLANALFGGGFTSLAEGQQDDILELLDDISQQSESAGEGAQAWPNEQSNGSDRSQGSGQQDLVPPERLALAEESFEEVDPGQFFTQVRTDTIEGMFADPSYGGNRGLVGWSLIGYPGAVRAWSPQQLLDVDVRHEPQPLERLVPMNPDVRHDPAREALEQPRKGVADG